MRAYRFATDAFVVIWAVAMLALGVLAMLSIDRLAAVADSLDAIAQQETGLAAALAPLESVPLAGPQVATADRQLRDASARTAANASVAGDSIRELGRIAFGVIALLALFPVVAFYLPSRLPRSALERPHHHGRRAAT